MSRYDDLRRMRKGRVHAVCTHISSHRSKEVFESVGGRVVRLHCNQPKIHSVSNSQRPNSKPKTIDEIS
jgi:hypothetical protein